MNLTDRNILVVLPKTLYQAYFIYLLSHQAYIPYVLSQGMTEEDADQQCDNVAVYTKTAKPLHACITDSQFSMFIKLLVDVDTDKVLGCHIMGEDAPEILQVGLICLKFSSEEGYTRQSQQCICSHLYIRVHIVCDCLLLVGCHCELRHNCVMVLLSDGVCLCCCVE